MGVDVDPDEWTGVQYDASSGMFCRVVVREDEVALVDVESGEAYETYESGAVFETEQELYNVSEVVVEDPVEAVHNLVNAAFRANPELADDVDYQYALEMTEFVEVERAEVE